jgi:hypothetical protein
VPTPEQLIIEVTIVGIRAFIVFIGITIALVMGTIVGMSDVRGPLAGWLPIVLVPVMWTLLSLIERATGRDVWHYTAPYPYHSMAAAPATTAIRRQAAPTGELTSEEAGEIRLAA